jgi:hypothetical protein
MFIEIHLFESPELTSLDFCLMVWMKSEVSKESWRIVRSNFECCWLHKKRQDQLRRTTHDLRTRVANCTEAGGRIFEYLL